MKRYLSLLLCLTLLLISAGVLSSCKADFNQGDKPVVVTTIFAPYDFARAVGGDAIDAHVLVTVTDSHSFSPTAADMALIEECDLFVFTGGDGDRWAEDFLSTIDTSGKIIINMMELCPLCKGEVHDHHDGDGHDHDHDHESAESYDEHVWMDPENAMRITQAICDGLSSIDQAGKDRYTAAAADYLAKLKALDEAFLAMTESVARHEIVVADRFPYRYLCHAYGIEAISAISGCGSASDLTAIAYEELAHHVREDGLPVIFCTEYSDRSVANTVLRESGADAEILPLHSCHTLTKYQIAKGTSYLSLMQENLRILTIALN